MNKKLAKTYFFSLWIFCKPLDHNDWMKERDLGRTSVEGFWVGLKPSMEKSMFLPCPESQPGLVPSGSVHSTWPLPGAAHAEQMAELCAVRFQRFFCFWVVVFFFVPQQHHDCIISHTWQRAQKCPESLFVFVLWLLFSLKVMSGAWRCLKLAWARRHWRQTGPLLFIIFNIKCAFLLYLLGLIGRQVFSQLHRGPCLYMDV